MAEERNARGEREVHDLREACAAAADGQGATILELVVGEGMIASEGVADASSRCAGVDPVRTRTAWAEASAQRSRRGEAADARNRPNVRADTGQAGRSMLGTPDRDDHTRPGHVLGRMSWDRPVQGRAGFLAGKAER